MNTVSIRPLGEHPDLIDLTVRWHLAEFDPDGDFAFWRSARTREAKLQGVPCAWVAFVEARPVGTVSLIECNMDTHPELTPWLAALYVLPEYRNRGIGKALVHRCEREAMGVSFRRLYLFTSEARNYYTRLGWKPFIEDEPYEDVVVSVMSKDLPEAGSVPKRRRSVPSGSMDEVTFQEYNVSVPIAGTELAGFFEGWASKPSASVLLSILAGSYCSFVARTRDGRVVGIGSAISDGVLSASISLLEIVPEFRGAGIGSRLVELLLARLDGFYMVDLTCDVELVPFYQRFGMTAGTAMSLRRPHAIPSN